MFRKFLGQRLPFEKADKMKEKGLKRSKIFHVCPAVIDTRFNNKLK